jgi:hypothetical protein
MAALAGLFLVLLGIAAWVAGQARWRSFSAEWQARMHVSAPAPQASRASEESLPLPVQRYLRRVYLNGPVPAGIVRIRQEGMFNVSEQGERWVPFTAEQVSSLGEPAFDWDARVRMAPGVTVFVRDAYAGGEGLTEARVFGLWPVARASGAGAIAEGQLLRFLAEAPWYPMVLQAGGRVAWSEVDYRSARATLRHGALQASLLFTFAEDDSVMAVRAEARGRMSGGRLLPTPWLGRFWNYSFRNGVRIPLEGEVSWILPSGPQPYWRGKITEIRYELQR